MIPKVEAWKLKALPLMEFVLEVKEEKENKWLGEKWKMSGSQLKSPIHITCELQASKAQFTPH